MRSPLYLALHQTLLERLQPPTRGAMNVGHHECLDYFNVYCNFSCRQLALHVEIDDITVKGHALYRIGSFMNHSCDPNVGMVSPSFTSAAQWTCIKPISKGAELLDSYIPLQGDPTQSKKDRQHILNLHYKFNCHCSLCVQS